MQKQHEKMAPTRGPGVARRWLASALALALVAVSAASCLVPSSSASCPDGEALCDDQCMPAGSTCCHFGTGAYCPSGNACGTAAENVCRAQTCDQACQDAIVAYAIDDTIWLLNNEDLAGIPVGNQDKTAACPLGGTVHITGTTGASSSTAIETLSLTFDLQACAHSNTTYSLAFTGKLSATGTFSTDHTGPNAVTFASSSLTITGKVQPSGVAAVAVSETCPVSLTDAYRQVAGETGWLNGEICGRTAGD